METPDVNNKVGQALSPVERMRHFETSRHTACS